MGSAKREAPARPTKAGPVLRYRTVAIAAAGIVALAAGAIGLWALLNAEGSGAAFTPGRVAVHAIVPATAEGEIKRIAADMTDEILGAFSRRRVDAALAPEEDARQRRGKPEIAVSGSLSKEESRYVADLRFDDTSAMTLWSARFESGERSVLDFQKEIGDRAAFVVRCALARRDSAVNPERALLLSLYIKGCDQLLAVEDSYMLIETGKALVKAGPGEAGAHAFLAEALAQSVWDGDVPKAEQEKRRQAAHDAGKRALEIDPRNANAYYAMAISFGYGAHWAEREALLLKAADSDPGVVAIFELATFYVETGRWREALTTFRRAMSLDENAFPMMYAAQLYLAAGDRAEANRLFDQARRTKAEDTLWNEFVANAMYGDAARAAALLPAYAKMRSLKDSQTACESEFLKARQGARISGARLLDVCRNQDYLARRLAAIGEIDLAFAEAEKWFEQPIEETTFLFAPELREFRRDARFMPLAARLGLVDYWRASNHWPDFCAEPDFPYDCKAAAKAAQAK